MKRLIVGIGLVALLAGPAFAQKGKGKGDAGADSPAAMERKEKAKAATEIDLQYKAALDRTAPDNSAPVKVDPWANVRSLDAKSTDGKGDGKAKR